MTERENDDAIVLRENAVEGDIPALAERYDELAKIRLVWQGAADQRMLAKKTEASAYRLSGPARRDRLLLGQKRAAALEAGDGRRGDDYSWQSGALVSASVPQRPSQSSTSSPVACRPVSV